jgi:hypothetical protein
MLSQDFENTLVYRDLDDVVKKIKEVLAKNTP